MGTTYGKQVNYSGHISLRADGILHVSTRCDAEIYHGNLAESSAGVRNPNFGWMAEDPACKGSISSLAVPRLPLLYRS